MDAILVVNAGSSSVKFRVFEVEGSRTLRQLISGQVDGMGVHPKLKASGADDRKLVERSYEAKEVPDVETAMRTAGAWLRTEQNLHFMAIGHRVVHGGPHYDRPVLVNESVVADLERYVSLAPLHQPNNLAPIRVLMDRFPDMPQVACFDTAFHRGHSEVAERYAIPDNLYVEGVRRYGFHGLSYEYVAERLRELIPERAGGRTVVAHLGSGASMCAIADGRSVESTMGFTALDGLPMGTRPGQIDPGVVLYLLSEKRMSAAAVQDFLYKECGLKGLSGITNDVRDLMESAAPSAALALDHFVYRIGLYAGYLAAALGGIDNFVFTAGIGERSVPLRTRIAEKLAWLGGDLDADANGKGDFCISRPGSRLGIYVVPTNEELMIARHTLATLSAGKIAGAAAKRTA
ncbi:acetate/propionate family kinase [Pseudorhodoplanes sp.]|uniref:acetate/propionate family kinase n=1 Tax=Pseudorhodoplanes sp. TaxID=1934341 RepID=UPI002CD14743|nr:acetate/propionate family kinase [Pseudorhodoplanes sp.]HWV43183.1 acetate/propionate family kinase [Pseudorhodoplanes sp.]